MATTILKYDQATRLIMGDIDLNTSTLKLALITSGYTFDAAHTLFDNGGNDATDPSFNEVANGDGYTTGGATLGTPTLSTAGAVGTFDADDVTFTALTKTFRQGIIYASGTFETLVNPVLFRVLFDDTPADLTITGIDFVVKWNASGILAI